MSSELMRRTADVLEKVAHYLDEQETHHETVQTEQRQKLAHDLSDEISKVMGEELTVNQINKLASAEPELLETIVKLASSRSISTETPDELGEGATVDENNTAAAMTNKDRIKEAAAAADERILDWIMS